MKTSTPSLTDREAWQGALGLPSMFPREEGRQTTSDITREKPLQMLHTHEGSGPAWGTLTLELGRDTAQFRLSLESLERGVLLGRYARCAIPLEPLTSISRVHLMLVRVGPDVLAIDTASTCGTRRVLLSRQLEVHWQCHSSSAATHRR